MQGGTKCHIAKSQLLGFFRFGTRSEVWSTAEGYEGNWVCPLRYVRRSVLIINSRVNLV